MSLNKTNFGQIIHKIDLLENCKNKLNILCQLNLVRLVYMKCVCVKFKTVYIPTITSFYLSIERRVSENFFARPNYIDVSPPQLPKI